MSYPVSNDFIVEELDIKFISFAGTVLAKNVRYFLSIIRSLNFTTNTDVHFSDNGLKVIAEESQTFQAVAWIKQEFFSDFRYRVKTKQSISTGIDLSKLTEFLGAFIDNDLAKLKIVYYGDHRPMAIILNQTDKLITTKVNNDPDATFHDEPQINDNDESAVGLVTTEYFITAKQSINPINYTVVHVKSLSRIIMNAKNFLESLQEFDAKTIQEIQFFITKNKLIMCSVGVVQCETIIKMKLDTKIFQTVNISNSSRFKYKFLYFKHMTKALQMATSLLIETFYSGLIRLELMIKTEESENAVFIEFHMAASIDDEDDEEMDDQE